MATKFYLCNVCGNVVIKHVDSGANIICCGQQMQELIPFTNDFAKEKHLPVVECGKDGTIKVKVGSMPHPMTPEHHVSFIYLETEHGGQVHYLMPDDAPEAVFECGNDKPVAVYEYCNVHGLWKTEISGCCDKKKSCKLMSVLFASLLCFVPSSCCGQKVDNSTVKTLDLNRYLGGWYEIARYDHWFERDLTHAKAYYSLNDDGTISVTNGGQKNGKMCKSVGKAKTTDTVGLLRVSFFGPFYSDYRVMMLSEDYSYALVGSGNSKFLWILSRTPEIPDEVKSGILKVAADRGYDTGKLIWVNQSSPSLH